MTKWRLLTSDGVDAAAGLALDEALMAGYGRTQPPRPPTLRLYTYRDHCALVGHFQHLEAEVDLTACQRTATAVNRRPTGGGAIVMGSGQLGVAVITQAPTEQRPRDLLERFSGGIVAGLERLGIHACFRGKNDLVVDGRKIAGLGLYLNEAGALLFHSSILADLDVDFMLDVLQIPAAKLAGAGVAAVQERVTTVSRQTGQVYDGARLRPEIAAGFSLAMGVDLEPMEPTESEDLEAQRLVAERYGRSDWLHHYSPRPDRTASATARLEAGTVRVYVALHGQTIKSVLFTGDFNVVPPGLLALEEALRWKRMERTVLQQAVTVCLGAHPEIGNPDVVVDALLETGFRSAPEAIVAPKRNGSCYFPEVGGQT